MLNRKEKKQHSRQSITCAALKLCMHKHSFSHISIREISRETGLVPSAFYRHFPNLEVLGLELVDNFALHFKTTLYQLGKTYLEEPNDKLKKCLEFFLKSVEENTEQWYFWSAERWGCSDKIRQAIAVEIDFIIEEYALFLKRISNQRTDLQVEDFAVLIRTLIDLSYHWSMNWLSLNNESCIKSDLSLVEQQIELKQQMLYQLNFLFKDI